MITYMCAVKDDKTNCFMDPFAVTHTGRAVRGFTDAIKNPEHEFGKHAADFDLYVVGEFDPDIGSFNGKIDSDTTYPYRLVRGGDLVQS